MKSELASANASLAAERASGERERGIRDQQITALEREISSLRLKVKAPIVYRAAHPKEET